MRRLDEIEARCNAATPPPWESVEADDPDDWDDDGSVRHYPYKDDRGIWEEVVRDGRGDCRPDDRLFIAHAREDVPALLAVAKAAEALLSARDTAKVAHDIWVQTHCFGSNWEMAEAEDGFAASEAAVANAEGVLRKALAALEAD